MKRKKIGCGFDCGGTNLKCYCNVNNKEIKSVIPTGKAFTKEQLVENVTEFVKSIPYKVDVIGIAFSGIGSSTHINITGLSYLQDLDVSDFAHLGCHTRFVNDSNAAALCGLSEYPDAKVLIGITNGTGIGSGLCINGEIFSGANGFAGEISGNMVPTSMGNTRISRFCSGSFLAKAIEDEPSERGRLIEESAINFGLLVTHLINFINPDVIYLSGGIFRYEKYFETVVKTVNEYALKYMLEDLKVVLSTKGAYSGCIGAIENALK